jgi:hypothetical protein
MIRGFDNPTNRTPTGEGNEENFKLSDVDTVQRAIKLFNVIIPNY